MCSKQTACVHWLDVFNLEFLGQKFPCQNSREQKGILIRSIYITGFREGERESSTCSCLELFRTFQNFLELFRTIQNYLELFGTIQNYLELFGTIKTVWNYLELSRTIQNYLELMHTENSCEFLYQSHKYWFNIIIRVIRFIHRTFT